MSSLYPTLEDMKVYHMLTPQDNAVGPQPRAPAPAPPARETLEPPKADEPPVLYPNLADLNDYMGLSLSSEEIQKNLGLVPTGSSAMGPSFSAHGPLVAPVTGSDVGLHRAEIKPGLREIQLCKDERGKTGLKLRNIDKFHYILLEVRLLACLGHLGYETFDNTEQRIFTERGSVIKPRHRLTELAVVAAAVVVSIRDGVMHVLATFSNGASRICALTHLFNGPVPNGPQTGSRWQTRGWGSLPQISRNKGKMPPVCV
ncbi:syntenin-2 [Erythrolamprus reginae]|uniref:syntenin-2 n=1 Tax=Erythrolamprus reginae TaxID=121349 RepID=UPI00396CC15B